MKLTICMISDGETMMVQMNRSYRYHIYKVGFGIISISESCIYAAIILLDFLLALSAAS